MRVEPTPAAAPRPAPAHTSCVCRYGCHHASHPPMCLWHARREQQQLLGQLQAGHRAATQGGASHVQVRARRRGGGARWAAWLLCWSRPAMQAAHAGSSCRLPSLMLPSVMPGCTPPPFAGAAAGPAGRPEPGGAVGAAGAGRGQRRGSSRGSALSPTRGLLARCKYVCIYHTYGTLQSYGVVGGRVQRGGASARSKWAAHAAGTVGRGGSALLLGRVRHHGTGQE